MRTAVTIGITKAGTAEVISHPKVAYAKQRTAFHQLGRGKNDKYVEVQFFPSKGRMLRRRFKKDDEGGVNYNAAHRVEDQQDKSKKKKLPDLTPKPGDKGRVNPDAAIPVEKQGKAKKSGSARSRRGGKSARVRKATAKKTAKKATGAHTAGAKVAGATAGSAVGKNENASSDDSGPKL